MLGEFLILLAQSLVERALAQADDRVQVAHVADRQLGFDRPIEVRLPVILDFLGHDTGGDKQNQRGQGRRSCLPAHDKTPSIGQTL